MVLAAILPPVLLPGFNLLFFREVFFALLCVVDL